jgi:penicillin-binding protein 2
LIDSIEGGDDYQMLARFKVKQRTKNIAESIFEEVHEGMQGTMEFGTGAAAKVPGINVCGKTGTVENAYRGESLKDHAFFGAFAPRENPRIAIAVMCENAGFGATSAAPIASLLIEKYLRDSIAGPDRKAKIEQLANMNLIPPQMSRLMKKEAPIKKPVSKKKDPKA